MNNNKPIVSIIIPVFNAEKYISKCLDSVIASNYKNIEIIVVDDGSIDASLSIIEAYKKRDFRIKVYSQKNKGAGEARNKGLEIANGEYVLFVDADDILCQSAISNSIDVAKERDTDIVMFNYKIIDEDYKTCMFENKPRPNNYDLEVWSCSDFWANYFGNNLVWCVAPWGKLYKIDLFKNVRFKNKYYEDEYILHELIKEDTNIVVLNEMLYLYRVHKQSTMAKPFSKRYLDKFDCFLQRLGIFVKSNNFFAGEAALMLIHSCNVIRKHSSIIGEALYKEKIAEANVLLKETCALKIDGKYKKKIKSFLTNNSLYYFIHYSNFAYKLTRLCCLPSKVKYYFSLKKSLKVVSKCLCNGYYKVESGCIKKVNKPSSWKPNVFKIKTKSKMAWLSEGGKIIQTKYKRILICDRFTLYFSKTKKRYFESKHRYELFADLLTYPLMKLTFDDNNFLIIGETVTGIKFKRNEMFNLVLDFMFDYFAKAKRINKQIRIESQNINAPFYIQHGDIKDSNIIWNHSGGFCLIDLEAINEKPIFFDLFFYVLISKKRNAYITFRNHLFRERIKEIAANAGFKNATIDTIVLIYLSCLMDGYRNEHTKSYYDYYLKDLCFLVFNEPELVKCQNYLNDLKDARILKWNKRNLYQ